MFDLNKENVMPELCEICKKYEPSLEELCRLDRMDETLKEPCRLLPTVEHVR